MRVLLRFAAAFSLLAALSACAIDDPGNRFDDIRFTGQPPIGLDVGTIEITQSFKETRQAPNVEHRFPVAPGRAAQNWAEDRLSARGDRLTFRYVVRTASAVETELPKTTGVSGLVTTDQSERYEIHIVIDMQILDGRELRGTANAEARRSTTVPEGISLNERERIWYKLTQDTMNDLNDQLETTIKSAFFPYIVL